MGKWAMDDNFIYWMTRKWATRWGSSANRLCNILKSFELLALETQRSDCIFFCLSNEVGNFQHHVWTHQVSSCHVSRRFQAGAASLRLHLRFRGPLPGVPGAASSASEGVTTPSCSSLALRAGTRFGFLAAIGALIGTTEGTFLEAGEWETVLVLFFFGCKMLNSWRLVMPLVMGPGCGLWTAQRSLCGTHALGGSDAAGDLEKQGQCLKVAFKLDAETSIPLNAEHHALKNHLGSFSIFSTKYMNQAQSGSESETSKLVFW